MARRSLMLVLLLCLGACDGPSAAPEQVAVPAEASGAAPSVVSPPGPAVGPAVPPPSGGPPPPQGSPGHPGTATEPVRKGELPVLAPELRAQVQAGLAKVEANDYDGALVIFSEIITTHPEVFDAYDHRSMIYYNRQEYAKVAEDCTHAIDIAKAQGFFDIACPERCLTRRGASYLNLERWAEALADFDVVLTYRPNDGFTWFERGRALYGLGRNPEAKEAFEKALALNPEHPVAGQLSPYYLKKIEDPEYH